MSVTVDSGSCGPDYPSLRHCSRAKRFTRLKGTTSPQAPLPTKGTRTAKDIAHIRDLTLYVELRLRRSGPTVRGGDAQQIGFSIHAYATTGRRLRQHALNAFACRTCEMA